MSAQTATPPRRTAFATTERAEARAFLESAYGARLQVSAHRGTDWRVQMTQVDTGLFSCGGVTLPAHLTFAVHGREVVGVSTLSRGLVRMDLGRTHDRFRGGDVFVGTHPEAEGTSQVQEAAVRTVVLPTSLLTEVAGRDPAAPAARWEISSLQPVPGGAARWRRTTRLVDDLLAETDTTASPLLLGPAARLLAATALTVFPNTVLLPPAPADRADAHPATLHRAIAFIEAECDRDLSVVDIAAAACVTPRTVQLAFRRHLSTTPTAYLRAVRLAQAHQQLRDATPDDGTTVTAVAARWGFTPSGFATAYRTAYGVTPSHTLRS